MERVCGIVAPMLAAAPPDIESPNAGDLWNLLKTGRRFRKLGKRDGYRLLRWAPMPVADLMDEWFESDLLRATVAAPALSGTMFGPRSAGSALLLLMQEAHRMLAGNSTRVRGGPGALTGAMAAAARAAGAEIRTGAPVERIVVANDHVAAVVVNGEQIPVARVLSAIDPKTTFLRLIDPSDLGPDFRLKIEHFRARGTTAKINLALSALPTFNAARESERLSGRIHIGPAIDYLERAFDHAKYGEMSSEPWLDVMIPSIIEPALAPAGAHVMSIVVHYAPHQLRAAKWDSLNEQLLDTVLRTLDRYAPGIRSLIVASQVITPAELESEYGFHGGHIFHGELALDQFFTMRPLLGYARYDSPVRGLHLCGAGTHPGGFMTGASGRLAATSIRNSSY
jgi:phytoene dehydrogenase-like protein